MKLRDAEVLLRMVKEQGPIKEHWFCETDEGVILEAWPLGFARGSMAMLELSVRPRTQYSTLFTGGNVRQPHAGSRGIFGTGLWEQEFFVYMREMKEEVAKALEELWKIRPLPRTRDLSSIDPQPEDFARPPRKPKGLSIGWYYNGAPDRSEGEIQRVKTGFYKLLEEFVTEGGPHGQRTIV